MWWVIRQAPSGPRRRTVRKVPAFLQRSIVPVFAIGPLDLRASAHQPRVVADRDLVELQIQPGDGGGRPRGEPERPDLLGPHHRREPVVGHQHRVGREEAHHSLGVVRQPGAPVGVVNGPQRLDVRLRGAAPSVRARRSKGERDRARQAASPVHGPGSSAGPGRRPGRFSELGRFRRRAASPSGAVVLSGRASGRSTSGSAWCAFASTRSSWSVSSSCHCLGLLRQWKSAGTAPPPCWA